MADRVGQQLGNYRLLRLLGRGAFAEVYLGEHLFLERPAAIKILHVQMDSDTQELFQHEARTIAHLQHPHIVQVLDFGIYDQTPYLVMEYTPNSTLRVRHPKGTRLPLEQIVVYVKQIALALDYAHQHRVIHRDIKPDNFLLNAKNELLLSDFGLAVVQQSMSFPGQQEVAGTPSYMAPEQFNGRPVTASDQYSLAIMVYEWICGELPFRGNIYELMTSHLSDSPPSLCEKIPTLLPSIEDTVFGALAKDPQHRFVNVQEFADVLEENCIATQPFSLFSSHKADVTTPPEPLASMEELDITDRLAPLAPDISSLTTQHAIQPLQQTPLGERGQAEVPRPSPLYSLYPESSSQLRLNSLNRRRLLAKVRSYWIKGVLDQSLHGAALIALGMRENTDAIINPWELVVRQPDTTQSPLPTGTHIIQVYDDAGGELLLLGAPGSGKTTLLLELARVLLDRAEREENHSLPVVFNLSSWSVKRQSIKDWLVEELNNKYQVPHKVARLWVNTDQILPLLDGLDEVTPAQRTACIEAINFYRQEHGLASIVVCSRTADYLMQTTRVQLIRAVVVQPLQLQQIDEYLSQMGEKMLAVRIALRIDKTLQELAMTPLMLSILALAYYGKSVDDILTVDSADALLQQIFEHYVQRMLARKEANKDYTAQQIIQRLAWLARQLVENNQTEFYIERMQATWLPVGRRQLYQQTASRLLNGLIGGLVGGLIDLLISIVVSWSSINLSSILPQVLFYGLIGLFVGVFMRGRNAGRSQAHGWLIFAGTEHLKNGLFSGWVYGLSAVLVGLAIGWSRAGPFLALLGGIGLGVSTGLVGVLIGILISLLISEKEVEIKPMEVVNWSWTSMWRNFIRIEHMRNVLLVGLIIGLVMGIGVGLGSGEWRKGLEYGLSVGLIGLVVSWFAYGLFGGLSGNILDKRHLVTPNQGIWRSARNALLVGLSCGSVLSLVLVLIVAQANTLGDALLSGLLFGLGSGFLSGLFSGGDASIRHFVLRFFLWKANLVAWNYPRFLDYAAGCVLLHKVGGGYIFVHRLLLDYFASLNVTKTFIENEGEHLQDITLLPTQPF